MAFPQVLGTSKGVNGSNTTSHNVTLPTSIAAGELLIVCLAFDGNVTPTGTPSGWSVVSANNTASGTPAAYIAWKRAVGTESGTTITFQTVQSEQSSYVAVRMSVNTLITFLPNALTGNSTNSTFSKAGSALIPAKDYTFFGFRSGDGSVQPTAASASYTLVDSQAGGGTGASVYVQDRELNAQTDTAGAMTVATEQWVTFAAALYFDSFTIEKETAFFFQSTTTTTDAFSFESNGLNLKRISIYAFKGSTAGTCYAELYAHSGTFGTNGVPTGSVLATTATETITGTSEFGQIDLTFATPYQTTNATPYFIRIVTTGSVVFQYIGGGTTSTTGNTATFSGGVWTPSSTANRPPYVLLSVTGVSGTITETTTGTETQSVTANFASSISETATATDLTDETLQTSASITEAATATETTDATKGGITADLTEVASGTESQSVTATFSRSITETGAGADSITATATFTRTISEAGAAADSVSVTGSFSVSLTETATGQDSQTGGVVYAVTISEASTATDSIVAGSFLSSTISEVTAGTDSQTAIYVLGVTISEAASGTDSQSVTRTSSLTISEAATASDSTASTLTAAVTISETGAATDTINRTATLTASISEVGLGQDSILAGLFSSKTITETTTPADTYSATTTTGIGYLRNGKVRITLTAGKVGMNMKQGSIDSTLKTGQIENKTKTGEISNAIKTGTTQTRTGI